MDTLGRGNSHNLPLGGGKVPSQPEKVKGKDANKNRAMERALAHISHNLHGRRDSTAQTVAVVRNAG